MREKIIGIYKITSPSGRVYIGQSDNIYRRFGTYKRVVCKDQPKLYNSFLKYGVENHKFEIIVECSISELNDFERYYQDLYNCIDPKTGLNCVLQETNTRRRILTKELSEKIRVKHKGKKVSEETRVKMSLAKKGIKGLDHNTSVRIKAVNIYTKEVVINSVCEIAKYFNVDKELIFNRCNKQILSHRKLHDWDIDYLDKKVYKEFNLGKNKPILDTETGIYYYGKNDLFNYIGIKRRNVSINSRYIIC